LTKIIKYQLIVLFLGALFLPFLNDGIGFAKFKRKNENRNFKDSLVLDISTLDYFPLDAEEYINDNFSFREPLLQSFSRIKYYAFGVSPKPEHTILGYNGWLFMDQFEIACYAGRENFDEKQLDSLNQLWAVRKTFFEEKGIKSYWLLAPIKHSIYFDEIPFKYLRSTKISRVDQIKSIFKNTYPEFVIDPSPEILEASVSDKVFYKMDNHWNFKAGLIATKKLLNRLSVDFPEIKNDIKVKWKDTLLQKGIHYDVLGLDELSETDFVPVLEHKNFKEVKKFGFVPPEKFPYGWEYERYFKNPNSGNKLKVLVIRDSFGEQMMPFLAESFSETLFIFDKWEYGLNEDIIEFYKPDIIIYITLETLVNNLLYEKS